MSDFVEGNYTDKYNSVNFIHKWLMKRFLKSFERMLQITKARTDIKRVAEIGCGEGELLKIVHRYFPEAKLYACDLSPNEIKKAKENTKGIDIEFSVQDAENLDKYKTNQFDLVICCEVLEHLNTPENGINELKRISNNYVITSVPVEPLWRILNVLRLKYLPELGNTPGHFNHWSVRSFTNFVKQEGLINLKSKLPLPWQMNLLKVDKTLINSEQEAQGLLSPFLKKQRYLHAASHINKSDVVLDIGCGKGGFKDYISANSYYGVDYLNSWGFSDYLFQADIYSGLPKDLVKIPFTAVVSLALLEHLKDPNVLFREAGRVLEENGLLILTTPHPIGRKVHDIGAKLGIFSGDASEEHETFFDEKDMKLIAKENGFKMMKYHRFLFGMNQLSVFRKI